MKGLPRWLITTGAVVVALAVIASAPVGAGRREKPPPCPPGRYLLPEPLLDAGSPAGALVSASDAAVAIEGVCDPIPPRKYKGTRRGTKLKAKWPACAELDGKVRLGGKIVEDCETLIAKVKAKRFKRRFEAPRSVCGDGVVDEGGGEECEPPGSAVCDAACREVATVPIGMAGGMVTSVDGLLTLIVPPGALSGDVPITVRRLTPEDIPQVLRDGGADVAYELGPDGLEFTQPITATLRLDEAPIAPDGSLVANLGLLATFSADGATLGPVGDPLVTADGEANLTTASGTLTHFTGLTYIKFDPATPRGRPLRNLARLAVTAPLANQEILLFREEIVPALLFQLLEIVVPDFTPVFHNDQTTGPSFFRIIGPERVEIGQVRSGSITNPDLFNRTARASTSPPLPIYQCNALGLDSYRMEITLERPGFVGALLDIFGTSVILRFRVIVPVRCVLERSCAGLTSTDRCELGSCPEGQVCAVAEGECRCVDPEQLCGEDDMTGLCGGLCIDGRDRCARSPVDPESPCTCRRACLELEPADGDQCAEGICDANEECTLVQVGTGLCVCFDTTPTTTTTSSSTTTSTTTSSSTTTSTSTSTTTTTSTSTTTTTFPACCECGTGCADGVGVTVERCESGTPTPVCTPGPGTFVPGAVCDTQTGNCVAFTTTMPSTTSTTSSSSSTTSTTSSTSTTASSVSTTSTSTTTSTTLPTTTTTQPTTTTSIPAGPCTSLDGTACGGTCPGDQVCRALESRTGGGCLCIPPGSACPEGQPPDPQLGFCGGLCPREDQLCADDGGTCVCSTCRLFDVDGTPTCFGGCADQFETCAAIGGDCACVPNNEFCQPQGGGMCAGRCPSPNQDCAPSGAGCVCQAQP